MVLPITAHCTGGANRASVTPQAGAAGLDPRAVDEATITDQYWPAPVTATQWH